MITPQPLKQGDVVAILSPASAVDPMLIEGAANALSRMGFRPRIMPHAAGREGTYSASMDSRLADINAALADPDVKAILCSRGGYGAVHLLDSIVPRPVWLIGFSDISALHALWSANGIRSVHGSMARHLALFSSDDPANRSLHSLLTTGVQPSYTFAPHSLNRQGHASGVLAGGNMAVLTALVGTPLSLLRPDTIMVIEDIAEPVYKVQRMLYQLRLAGILPRLRGLIVGQFTEYRPDANYSDMESMIAEMVAPYTYPVAFNAPFGHVDGNLPFLESSDVVLSVGTDAVTLTPAD